MSKSSWKDHERFVAKYFNTTRRNRGNDFGQSDVEIMATLEEWLGWPTSETVGLIVECKYSKKHPILKIHKSYNIYDIPTIIIAGNVMHMTLSDFQKFFVDYIWVPKEESKDVFELVYDYNIIKVASKEPEYMKEYIKQARDYCIKYSSQGKFLPIACLAKAKSKNRLVCFDMDDVKRFQIQCDKEIYQKEFLDTIDTNDSSTTEED